MTVSDNRDAAAAAAGVSRAVIDKLAERYGEPVFPRCKDCGGKITRTWRDGDWDFHCPGQCD